MGITFRLPSITQKTHAGQSLYRKTRKRMSGTRYLPDREPAKALKGKKPYRAIIFAESDVAEGVKVRFKDVRASDLRESTENVPLQRRDSEMCYRRYACG